MHDIIILILVSEVLKLKQSITMTSLFSSFLYLLVFTVCTCSLVSSSCSVSVCWFELFYLLRISAKIQKNLSFDTVHAYT